MDAKRKSKGIEEELIEKANEKAYEYGKAEGVRRADYEIQGNIDKFEQEANPHVKGIKEAMRMGVQKYQLNIESSVFFILACQLFITFFLLLFLYIFAIIFDLILMLVIIFIVVVYCGAYCLISRYPLKFKRSSLCFLMCIILAISEALMLCFLSIPISTKVFLIEVSIVLFSLIIVCIASKILKEKYSVKTGIVSMVLSTLVAYVLFMIMVKEYLWLTLCTVCVVGYEWFLVRKVHEIIAKLTQENEDNFQGGLYVSLLIFKAKVDLFVNLGFYIFGKLCKKPDQDNTEI